MSSFDINNHHHHHHKTSSITITANYYYCYCCCCCCWGCDDTILLMILIIGFTCPPTVHFKFIIKCNKCSYKVRQLILLQRAMVCYFKVRQVFLQSATGITKCDNFISICDRYYKVRQNSSSSETQGQLVRTTECSWWKITVKMNILSSRLAVLGLRGWSWLYSNNYKWKVQWSLRALSICQNWQARPFPSQWQFPF